MPETRSTSRRRKKVLGVIFDYGKVLSLPQEPSALKQMAEICEVPVERFSKLYWESRGPYDRGDMSAEAFWATMVQDGRVLKPEELEQLVSIDSVSWGRPNELILGWAERLRGEGFTVAVLSNMPLEVSRYLVAHRDWLSLFHHLIFSCDVRAVKPNPVIYQHCLDVMKLTPRDVLFLDDKIVNVKAAVQMGIHALVFDSAEQVLAHVSGRFDLPMPISSPESSPATRPPAAE